MEKQKPSLGIFTTDSDLNIRAWDPWMAAVTGLSAEAVYGKPITEIIPDLRERHLDKKFAQVLSQGTVEVLAPLFHRYLIACAPVEPATRFSRMRQRVTIMPLREGEKVSGTLVLVEDVTRRLEQEQQEAPAEGTSGDAAPLVGILGDRNWRVRKEAVSGLIQHGGKKATAALLRTLEAEHEDFGALNSALEVLTFSRVDVIPALMELLADGQGDLRIYVAQVLGDKGDGRAVPALLMALDNTDPNVRYHVIEALGKLRAVEAVDRLVQMVQSGGFYLAFPAIDALTRIGEPRVAGELVPMLKDDLLRTPTAELLGNLGDEEVVAPLVELLNQPGDHVTVIATALCALRDRYESLYGEGDHIADLTARHMDPSGVQNLLDILPHAAETDMRPLAVVLGWLEGPAVERSLTRLLGHPEARSQVVTALVRYGGRVTALLTEQLTSTDLEIRYAATIALGRIGDAKAVPALLKSLENDPELTIVAAGALAKIGDRNAYDALLALLGHGNTAVRQAVISALNSLGHPKMSADMVRLMKHENPLMRESAVKIAGYFGYSECMAQLVGCCRDENENVRKAVVEHLAYLEEDAAEDAVIHALMQDTPKVRAAAARGMAHLDGNRAREPLLEALKDADPWVRYFAVRSIRRHGYAHATPVLYRIAETDEAPQVRIEAMGALGEMDPEHAVSFLAPFVSAPDVNIARAAIQALSTVGPPHAMPALLKALRNPDPHLKKTAIAAVGRCTTREAAEMLQWLAASEKSPEMAQAAMDALSDLGTSDAVSALVHLTADPANRDCAVRALSRLSRNAISLLGRHLSHPKWQVKRAVIDALTRMKHPDATACLISALKDPAPQVRISAIRALAKLGSRSARNDILNMARHDGALSVQREAAKALARL